MLNHTYLWKVTPSKEHYDEGDESVSDNLFTPSADARKLYEKNHAKKMQNGKDRREVLELGLALEVKGAGCCTNPWANARVFEKNLDQSWK